MALATQTPKDYYAGSDKGSYRFIKVADIINNFIVSQIGDDKIIKSAKRAEVAYHAQRGIAELNYDVLGQIKTQEIELPPSLSIALPHDFVNIVEVAFIDDAGLARKIHESSLTSEPSPVLQDSDYNYLFDSDGNVMTGVESESRSRFKNAAAGNNTGDSTDLQYLEEGYGYNADYGKRYGINPEHATKNGFFTINESQGTMNFTSDLRDKFISISYISDGLHSDGDMQIHKFAEEAIYKCISYGLASAKSNIPEYQINRIKKERRAAIRNAKIRLAKLSPSEIIQSLRNKSKQIKH